jgi:hypothetical protein
MIPSGKSKRLSLTIQVVSEYAIDTVALAEERQLLEHIATLTGKWKQKLEHGGLDGQPITISVAEVLRNRRARRLEAAKPALAGAAIDINATAPAAADPVENEPDGDREGS